MNPKVIILLCAVPLGIAGGYAWSAMTAPQPPAYRPMKPKMVAIPPSPSELPEPGDKAWTERADDAAAVRNESIEQNEG